MKSGKWQSVQVQNQGRIWAARYFSILSKRDARDCRERAMPGQRIHKVRKSLLRFTSHH